MTLKTGKRFLKKSKDEEQRDHREDENVDEAGGVHAAFDPCVFPDRPLRGARPRAL